MRSISAWLAGTLSPGWAEAEHRHGLCDPSRTRGGSRSSRSGSPPVRPRIRPCLPRRFGLAALALACLVSTLAPGLAHAVGVLPPAPYRMKEAALIRHNDIYHLFYTRGNPSVPFDSTWNDLGHTISVNLKHWDEQQPVMPARPGEWDDHQVWAPAIIESGSLFYMFYTGVSDGGIFVHHQRIGVASSSDLNNWTRLDHPVFSCADVPWTHCDPGTEGAGDFRDPFVMPDPELPGHWVMLYTTRHRDAPGQLMIGRARSSGDLTQWVDDGPMWNTDGVHTLSSVVESPDLIEHDGLWYLLYTTWNAHPVWFQTALSPFADSTGWSPQTSLAAEVTSLESDESFGPEHYRVDGHDLYYMPNSVYDGIQILEYVWLTPPHFDLVEPWLTLTTDVGPPGAPPRPLLGVLGSASARRFRIDLWEPMRADLSILDAGGRMVRRLHRGALARGSSEQSWDGLSDAGTAVPSGIYFVLLDTPSGRRSARFAYLR